MLSDDHLLFDVLACAGAVIALGWLVLALARVAAGRRPGLSLAVPLAAAAGARLLAASLIEALPQLRSLRGPDEAGFINTAQAFAGDPSSLGPMPHALVGNLQIAYMGVEQYLLAPSIDYPLRVGHIALAIAAIAIVGVAVTDVAGVRAGALCAWILAFEPTNVFFSGVLHKESPVMLGEAIAILGAVRMYQRRDARAAAFMVLGLTIAGLTRPYAAAALGAACAAVCLHASLQRLGSGQRRSPRLLGALAVAASVVVAAAPAPAAVLHNVQISQDANATDGSNLALDAVDFSTVAATAQNIDSRVSALLLRPLPWQASNRTQRVGVIGTIVAWTLLAAMLVLAVTRLRPALVRLPPLLYILAMTTVVYALSTGNAGTGFRYRVHVLLVVAAIVAALACLPRQPLRKVADH
jgi:hypothetical protein